MSGLKASRYNLQAQGFDGTPLLFNSATLSLVALSPENLSSIQSLLKDPSAAECFPSEWTAELLRGGFLVPKDTDEMEFFRQMEETIRNDKSRLVVYVFPTLRCNVSCPYCFIGRQPKTMDAPTEEALLKYVDERLGDARHFTVVWYGGEPLLEMDRIRRLSRIFMEKAAQRGIPYDAAIYTNGHLLTRDVALELRQYGVKLVHTAFDGPRVIHDRRRALEHGGPTYDTLLRNLAALEGIFERFLVRVHVDRETAPVMAQLFDDMKDMGFHKRTDMLIRFAPLEALTPTSADSASTCYTIREYAALEIQLAKAALTRGLVTVAYPFHRPVYCMSHLENEMAVAPDGSVYHCLGEAGDLSKATESLPGTAPVPDPERNTLRFRNDSFANKENCRICHIEPLCGGGCFNGGLALYNGEKGYCVPLKYSIADVLKIYHAFLQRRTTPEDISYLYGPIPPEKANRWAFHNEWLEAPAAAVKA